MKIINLVLACMAILFFSGCQSTGVSKSDYNAGIRRINIGMSKGEFLNIFPSALPRGAKKYRNGTVEVLEVNYEYYSFAPTGNLNRNFWTGMEGHPQWFYFVKNRLVQYGDPEDWPKEADIVVEVR